MRPARRFSVSRTIATVVAVAIALVGVSASTRVPRATATTGVAYIGRIGSTTRATTSTTAVVTAGNGGVAAGDSVLIALLLSSTSSLTGSVTATDSAGNAYSVDRSVTDGNDGDRVLVISAHNVKALTGGATIALTFPSSAEVHVSADEFANLGALDRVASASGRTSPFSSTTTTTSQPRELLFGVVGNESGGNPTFASGWIAQPVLSVSTDHLDTAYQVPASTGSFAATGAVTGVWMASITTYLPATSTAPPPPVDDPPVAGLKVSPTSGTAPLAVVADATGSSDIDATPIASYRFDFGDGTITGPQAAATASHTYTAAGPFTVSVTATDTAGQTSAPANASVTVTVTAPPPPSGSYSVYAGYYDNHHPGLTQPKPNPWQGSPNVVFVGQPDGSSGGWDTSTVRVDNISNAPLVGVVVTVDIGSHHFAMWGTNTIPVGGTLIVAQMGYGTFDGSDLNPGGCYGCSAASCTPPLATIPVIHVTVGGVTTTFNDRGQILNTHGVDSAGCPFTGNRDDESEAWQALPPG